MNNHGGARKNAGRKKKQDNTSKSVQIAFRVTQEEKERLLILAKENAQTLSQYIVSRLAK